MFISTLVCTLQARMSTDRTVEHSRISRDWQRPFNGAYASHTANFLSVQILLWTRILMCADVSFEFKLSALYYSNWVAVSILVFGFAATIPYTISTRREQQVVVGRGPSLISELLPQWMISAILLVVCFILEVADYLICTQLQLDVGKWVYLALALIGIGLAVIAPDESNNRLLVSATVFYICLQRPSWFMDASVIGCSAFALFVSCAFDTFTLKANRIVMRPIEAEVLRIRMICKILLCLCLTVPFLTEFACLSIMAVIICSLFSYQQERRYGTLAERRCLREVPPRTSNGEA